jgi:hypothetical protein
LEILLIQLRYLFENGSVMKMVAQNNKMTNLQLELLKIFKYNLAESQLVELKEVLSQYFMNKVDSEMDKVWNEKNWSNSTMDSIVNQHTRTPYKL